MGRNKLWDMDDAELAHYNPKSQGDCEALTAEIEYREWCKECELDPHDEDSRDHYREATGASFWENADENDLAGGEDNMTKD